MKSKELVAICSSCDSCYDCQYEKECFTYCRQFKCYPFKARKQMEYTPEVYNDTQIQFQDFII